MKRSLVAVVVAVVAVFAFATPALAQYETGGVILNPPEIPAFTESIVNVSGVGCPPGSTANIYIVIDGSEVFLGSTQVADDPDGAFNTDVLVPALPPGEYTVRVRCGEVVLSAILTVVGTTTQAGPLPRTGADPWMFIRIAVLLVTIGGFLLLFARKRRKSYA